MLIIIVMMCLFISRWSQKVKADPGPHALLSSTEPRVQMDSINYNLSQFENYIGINNNIGSKFTENEEAASRLLGVIKQK